MKGKGRVGGKVRRRKRKKIKEEDKEE